MPDMINQGRQTHFISSQPRYIRKSNYSSSTKGPKEDPNANASFFKAWFIMYSSLSPICVHEHHLGFLAALAAYAYLLQPIAYPWSLGQSLRATPLQNLKLFGHKELHLETIQTCLDTKKGKGKKSKMEFHIVMSGHFCTLAMFSSSMVPIRKSGISKRSFIFKLWIWMKRKSGSNAILWLVTEEIIQAAKVLKT